jgi:hypothetical protein
VETSPNINGVLSDGKGKEGKEGKKASSAINSSFGSSEPEYKRRPKGQREFSTESTSTAGEDVHLIMEHNFQGQAANLKPFEAGASCKMPKTFCS